MAVLGSGPAGFYTAYRVMSKIEGAVVDMYEQLPVPYGLVRFGVAPDHPEVKVYCCYLLLCLLYVCTAISPTRLTKNTECQNCEEKFAEVASSPRFNFIGNLNVGKDLPLVTLKNHYDAILFAYGASKDRKLGIAGEEKLKGIYSARAFVGWYNGLPEYADLAPDLEAGEEAVIVGQGNVALDVARILLSNVDQLRKTDITDEALATLSTSSIKRVKVVGRRGPMQVRCSLHLYVCAIVN